MGKTPEKKKWFEFNGKWYIVILKDGTIDNFRVATEEDKADLMEIVDISYRRLLTQAAQQTPLDGGVLNITKFLFYFMRLCLNQTKNHTEWHFNNFVAKNDVPLTLEKPIRKKRGKRVRPEEEDPDFEVNTSYSARKGYFLRLTEAVDYNEMEKKQEDELDLDYLEKENGTQQSGQIENVETEVEGNAAEGFDGAGPSQEVQEIEQLEEVEEFGALESLEVEEREPFDEAGPLQENEEIETMQAEEREDFDEDGPLQEVEEFVEVSDAAGPLQEVEKNGEIIVKMEAEDFEDLEEEEEENENFEDMEEEDVENSDEEFEEVEEVLVKIEIPEDESMGTVENIENMMERDLETVQAPVDNMDQLMVEFNQVNINIEESSSNNLENFREKYPESKLPPKKRLHYYIAEEEDNDPSTSSSSPAKRIKLSESENFQVLNPETPSTSSDQERITLEPQNIPSLLPELGINANPFGINENLGSNPNSFGIFPNPPAINPNPFGIYTNPFVINPNPFPSFHNPLLPPTIPETGMNLMQQPTTPVYMTEEFQRAVQNFIARNSQQLAIQNFGEFNQPIQHQNQANAIENDQQAMEFNDNGSVRFLTRFDPLDPPK